MLGDRAERALDQSAVQDAALQPSSDLDATVQERQCVAVVGCDAQPIYELLFRAATWESTPQYRATRQPYARKQTATRPRSYRTNTTGGLSAEHAGPVDIERIDAIWDYLNACTQQHGHRRTAERFGVSRQTLWRFLDRDQVGRRLPRAVLGSVGDSVEALVAATDSLIAESSPQSRPASTESLG